MLPGNEDIREFLISEFGEEEGNAIVLFPEYADSFEGITMDRRVIYNANKAGLSRALKYHMDIEQAIYEAHKELALLCEAVGDRAPVINLGSPFPKD